jgi:positive regulator of sigma E activity
MLERGIVLKSDQNGVDIKMQASDACKNCHACYMDKNKLRVLHLDYQQPIKPGELVEVEVQPPFALKSAFLLFFYPLLMLILGYYLFDRFIDIPGLNGLYQSVFGAFLGVIIAYFSVHLYDRRLQQKNPEKHFRIVRVLENKFE